MNQTVIHVPNALNIMQDNRHSQKMNLIFTFCFIYDDVLYAHERGCNNCCHYMTFGLVLQEDMLADQRRDGIEDDQENTTTGSETHDLWCESIK